MNGQYPKTNVVRFVRLVCDRIISWEEESGNRTLALFCLEEYKMAAPRLDHIGEHRTAYEKNKKKIVATSQVCGICGNPLDPTQKYPHPLSTVVDHIVPISRGGHPSDLQNLQAAHRWCNRQKADKLFDAKGRFKEQEEVKSDDLPLHYNWQEYKAT